MASRGSPERREQLAASQARRREALARSGWVTRSVLVHLDDWPRVADLARLLALARGGPPKREG